MQILALTETLPLLPEQSENSQIVICYVETLKDISLQFVK